MAESFSFTNRRLDSLEIPVRGRKEYVDTQVPKLRLRVSPTNKSFLVLKFQEGKSKRITIGKYPEISINYARDKAREILQEINMGVDIHEKKRKQKFASLTLYELLELYLESRELKDLTIRDYRTKFKKFKGLNTIGKLSDITEDMILSLHTDLSKSSPTASACAFRYLSAVFNYAVALKYVKESPVMVLKKAKLIKKTNKKVTIIPADKLKDWLEAVDKRPLKYRVYFYLLIYTGCRTSEAQQLLREDVDLIKSTLIYRDTKNGSDMQFFICDTLKALIQEYLFEYPTSSKYLLFQTTNALRPIVTPSKQFAHIDKEIDFRITAHDVRRTFATIAETVGLNFSMIKCLLNHSSSSDITLSYIQTELSTKIIATKKIEAFINSKRL